MGRLTFWVFPHQIYDQANARYEVPLPLNLPAEAETDPLYSVSVSGNGEPFHFNVNRNTNGNTMYVHHSILTLMFCKTDKLA